MTTTKESPWNCKDCGEPVRDCLCESFDYEGTIRFTTDKPLTSEQLAQLIDIIALQILEPVDENQDDEDYATRNVEVLVKEVN
jgi:hypothetical protein